MSVICRQRGGFRQESGGVHTGCRPARVSLLTMCVMLMATAAAWPDGLSISTTEGYFCPGTTNNAVQVSFQNDVPRQGVHLGLSFNPEQLYVLDALPQGRILPPLSFGYHVPAPGRLVMVIFDPTVERSGIPPPSGDDCIVTLTFGVFLNAPSEDSTSIAIYGAIVADSLLQPVTPLAIQNLTILVTAGVSDPLTLGQAIRQQDGSALVEWQFAREYSSARSYLGRSHASGEEPVRLTDTPFLGMGPHRYVDARSPALEDGDVFYHIVLSGDAGDQEIARLCLERPQIPLRFAFYPPSPSPCDGPMTIRFDLPRREQVSLRVFDVAGRQFAMPVNASMDPGRYVVHWPDLRRKEPVPSGVYFLRLEAGDNKATRRVVIVR